MENQELGNQELGNQELGNQEPIQERSTSPTTERLSIPLIDVKTKTLLFLQIFWASISLFCFYEAISSQHILLYLLCLLSLTMNAILWFWYQWLKKCALYTLDIDFQTGELSISFNNGQKRYDFDAKLQDFDQIDLRRQTIRQSEHGKSRFSERYHVILSKADTHHLPFLIKSFDDEKSASLLMWQIEQQWADFRLNRIDLPEDPKPLDDPKPLHTISFQRELHIEIKVMMIFLGAICTLLGGFALWLQGIEGFFLGITALIAGGLFVIIYALSRFIYYELHKVYDDQGTLIAFDLIRLHLPRPLSKYQSIFKVRIPIDCFQGYLCSPSHQLGIQVEMSYLQPKGKKKGEYVDLHLIDMGLRQLDPLDFSEMRHQIRSFFSV